MEEYRPETAEEVYVPEGACTPEETYVPDEETRKAAIVRSARKVFSRMGWACFFMLVIATVLAVALAAIIQLAAPDLLKEAWAAFAISIISTQLVAMPCACLILKKMPRFIAEPQRFGLGAYLACVPVCVFLAEAGNIGGTILDEFLGRLIGTGSGNVSLETAFIRLPFWALVLLLALVGPFMEELLFRKVLIDRMRGYGEKLAVVTSALMFGLMHGNLVQSVYAFLVGLLFGYVYLRTGRIWGSYGLHFFMNFLTGVLPIQFAKNPLLRDYILGATLDTDDAAALGRFLQDPQTALFPLYLLLILLLAAAGLVILIVKARRLRFSGSSLQIPKGKAFSSVWLTAGMLFFTLLCLSNITYTLLQ